MTGNGDEGSKNEIAFKQNLEIRKKFSQTTKENKLLEVWMARDFIGQTPVTDDLLGT